ncbi:MAG: serine dehydratase subunit alpha family protein [Oscillospiraceae bacterium]|nr:serine dehydratase subunit alpha family protein [Oscillospiraceae bacterium]
MKSPHYRNFIRILEHELIPALGCTEPIAIAYAAAKARAVLGCEPEHIEIRCSGNIIKNVKGVTVPNSGGLVGIEAAAILGAICGSADSELEVLESVKAEDISRCKTLMAEKLCSVTLVKDVDNLYVVAYLTAGEHSASVSVVNRHTLITCIEKDGEVIFRNNIAKAEERAEDYSGLNVRSILDFADEVDIEDVRHIIEPQIELNSAIAREGLRGNYGASVGYTMLQVFGDNVRTRACAMAAAGSDARMGGCALPVIINSGSGNQGMTVCLPVIEYAKDLKVSEEKLYKALVLSNLIAIHLKKYIGSLSAFCGAVSAASAAGAGITYLFGGDYEEIGYTIVNTLGNVGGIVCDGAKASCAAKIASAVHAAIISHYMGSHERVFRAGEGFIKDDLEATIRSMGYIGRVGMKETDEEILNVMTDQVDL